MAKVAMKMPAVDDTAFNEAALQVLEKHANQSKALSNLIKRIGTFKGVIQDLRVKNYEPGYIQSAITQGIQALRASYAQDVQIELNTIAEQKARLQKAWHTEEMKHPEKVLVLQARAREKIRGMSAAELEEAARGYMNNGTGITDSYYLDMLSAELRERGNNEAEYTSLRNAMKAHRYDQPWLQTPSGLDLARREDIMNSAEPGEFAVEAYSETEQTRAVLKYSIESVVNVHNEAEVGEVTSGIKKAI